MSRVIVATAPVTAAAGSRRWLRASLAWLHLWVGFGVGSLFAVIGLSGSALVFHEELLHWMHPELARFEPTARPEVLAGILERHQPAGLRAVQFPTADSPTWMGFHADGRRTHFAPDDGRVLLERSTGTDPLLWLHDLHTHLLGGETGEAIVGVVGWISLGLMLTGLYLWWPQRGRMLAQLRVFRGPPVRRWLTWHRSSGVILLPLLLLSTLTGLGIVYHELGRSLLTRTLGGDSSMPSARPAAMVERIDWAQVLATAGAAGGDAALTRVNVPAADAPGVGFRARQPGEWHPTGRSLVTVDRSGSATLLVYRSEERPLGERAANELYPVHIGVAGGALLRWLTFLVGLLPAVLLVTGFLFWRRRTAARTQRPRRAS